MNIFSHIKDQIEILDVIKQYVELKPAGNYLKGTCPLHHEKTASFTVSPHKGIFYCFGCHAGGDVISFISKVENCSPIESVHYLADKYQLELPEDFSPEQSTQEKKQYFDICKLVATWCHEQLMKNPSVRGYLKNRKIDKQIMQHFLLGYFPGGSRAMQSLLTYAQQHQVLADDLSSSGIIIQGRQSFYSPFEERIIFPIKDHLGRFCGFGGRVFKKLDERAKYYNSKENPFFTKGELLFGMDLAKQRIQETGIVFLVEGYTDCIAMSQHGFTNTVATLGTACTAHHLQLLSRYAQKAYVLYDNDTAGKKALLRLAQLCWQAQIELSVIILPAQEDPASFLTAQGDLHQLIETAQDIFDFFIASLGTDFKNLPLANKLKRVRTILQTVSHVSDELTQDILLNKTAEVTGLPYSAIKQEFKRIKKHTEPAKHTKDSPSKMTHSPSHPDMEVNEQLQLPMLEKKIFSAIMNNIELLNDTNSDYLIRYLSPALRVILAQLHEKRLEKPAIRFAEFLDSLSDELKQLVIRETLTTQEAVEGHIFTQWVQQLQKKHWKIIVGDMKLKLAAAKKNNDEHQVAQILADLANLRKQILPHTTN